MRFLVCVLLLVPQVAGAGSDPALNAHLGRLLPAAAQNAGVPTAVMAQIGDRLPNRRCRYR